MHQSVLRLGTAARARDLVLGLSRLDIQHPFCIHRVEVSQRGRQPACEAKRRLISIFPIWCDARHPHENEDLFSWIWKAMVERERARGRATAFQSRPQIQPGRRWGRRRAVHFESWGVGGWGSGGGGRCRGGGVAGVIAFLTCPIKFPFRVLSALSAYAAPKWPGDYGK